MITLSQEIRQTLSSIGLDRTQMQVCVLLLQKNMLSIQDIANELALPRSSVQLACEQLLERNVLKIIVSGKRRIFYIEHPKAIKNYITYEENQAIARKTMVDTILPQLTALSSAISTESIEIRHLQGEDGFVETFYESLKQSKNGEVLRFSGDPAFFTIARDRLQQYREERMKKKIFARVLQPQTSYSEDEAKEARFKMREMRFLPQELYNPKVQASVWEDRVAITVWDKGLHSVIIENKSIADFVRSLFQIAWLAAK